MGLLNMIAHKWSANPATQSSSRTFPSGNPIETREQLWQEIGRLSFGHRSNLSDDPTYLRLLKERGRDICQNGAEEGNSLIEGLVAKARDLDQRIQSHTPEQVFAA